MNKFKKRPLPIGKNKNATGLFKDELGGKIMIEFAGLRTKTYAYLMNGDSEHKNVKGTKKCVIKRRLKRDLKRFKRDHHNVYTEQINEIALSSNDGKRSQTFGKITTYPYGTYPFKV